MTPTMKVFTVGLDEKPPMKEHPAPEGVTVVPPAPVIAIEKKKKSSYKGYMMCLVTLFFILLFAVALSELAYNRARDESYLRLRWAELRHRMGVGMMGGMGCDGCNNNQRIAQSLYRQNRLESVPLMAPSTEEPKIEPTTPPTLPPQPIEDTPQESKTVDPRFEFLRQILTKIREQAEKAGIDGTMRVSLIRIDPVEESQDASLQDGFGEVHQPQMPFDFHTTSRHGDRMFGSRPGDDYYNDNDQVNPTVVDYFPNSRSEMMGQMMGQQQMGPQGMGMQMMGGNMDQMPVMGGWEQPGMNSANEWSQQPWAQESNPWQNGMQQFPQMPQAQNAFAASSQQWQPQWPEQQQQQPQQQQRYNILMPTQQVGGFQVFPMDVQPQNQWASQVQDNQWPNMAQGNQWQNGIQQPQPQPQVPFQWPMNNQQQQQPPAIPQNGNNWQASLQSNNEWNVQRANNMLDNLDQRMSQAVPSQALPIQAFPSQALPSQAGSQWWNGENQWGQQQPINQQLPVSQISSQQQQKVAPMPVQAQQITLPQHIFPEYSIDTPTAKFNLPGFGETFGIGPEWANVHQKSFVFDNNGRTAGVSIVDKPQQEEIPPVEQPPQPQWNINSQQQQQQQPQEMIIRINQEPQQVPIQQPQQIFFPQQQNALPVIPQVENVPRPEWSNIQQKPFGVDNGQEAILNQEQQEIAPVVPVVQQASDADKDSLFPEPQWNLNAQPEVESAIHDLPELEVAGESGQKLPLPESEPLPESRTQQKIDFPAVKFPVEPLNEAHREENPIFFQVDEPQQQFTEGDAFSK